MSGSSEREAMWQRVIQIPTRALFKRYLKATKADKGRATQVLHEYKRLLTLKALELDVDGTRVAGSPSLTAMWQQHVLDTAAYAHCCTALCGSLLHHSPDAPDEKEHGARCHRALQLYRRHFGEDPPVHTWDFGDIGPPRSSMFEPCFCGAPARLPHRLSACLVPHLLSACLVALGSGTWDFGDIGPPRSSMVDMLPSRAPVRPCSRAPNPRAPIPTCHLLRCPGSAAAPPQCQCVHGLVALGSWVPPGGGPATGTAATASKLLELAASKAADPTAFAHPGPAWPRMSTRRLRSGRAPRHRAARYT